MLLYTGCQKSIPHIQKSATIQLMRVYQSEN